MQILTSSMSRIAGLRASIKNERRRNSPHYTAELRDKPQYDYVLHRIRTEKEGSRDAGFQPLKREKKQVAKDRQLKEILKEFEDHGGDTDSESDSPSAAAAEGDDSDDAQQQNSAVWKGPDLSRDAEVRDLNAIIKSVKAEGIRFDKEATVEGKKSAENLFHWLEQYARLEYRKKRDDDDKAFGIDAGGILA